MYRFEIIFKLVESGRMIKINIADVYVPLECLFPDCKAAKKITSRKLKYKDTARKQYNVYVMTV